MKKIIVIAAMAVMATSMFAQQEGKIRGSLNLGTTIHSGIGFCFDAQLGYNIADNMTVGAKYGWAAMIKGDDNNAKAQANVGYLATFTYFLNPGGGKFAPFGGAGLGAYTIASAAGGDGYASAEAGTVFGGMLTAGFEIGAFRLAVEYNLIPSSKVKAIVGNNTKEISNSYLAITLGFKIGGGKWGGDRR
jgi:outer membrane protein X